MYKMLSFILSLAISATLAHTSNAQQPSNAPPIKHFKIGSETVVINKVTGQQEERAWIEHADRNQFRVELQTGIQAVRLFRLSNRGDFQTVHFRMEKIRERLEYLVDRLNKGMQPRITLRRMGQGAVGIYVECDPSFPGAYSGYYPIRIMTVTQEDASDFPFLEPQSASQAPARSAIRTPESLAAFFSAQIEAHFLLFLKVDREYKRYEQLTLNRVISGKIYRELYIRAIDVQKLTGRALSADMISDALDRIPMYQRERLQTMSRLVPRDWAPRHRGQLYFQ